MSYLPEGATFEERVQDYFLAVRGSGLMLSALDGELLSEWSRSGVPFEVVARGIRRSAERALFDARPGEPILRTLRACRRQVDSEIQKHLSLKAGAHEKKRTNWEEQRKSALLKLLSAAKEARPELSAETERLGCLVRESAVTPDSLAWLEDAIPVAICRALPFTERRSVWREALPGGREGWSGSAAARKLGRRVRIASALRRRLSLA